MLFAARHDQPFPHGSSQIRAFILLFLTGSIERDIDRLLISNVQVI